MARPWHFLLIAASVFLLAGFGARHSAPPPANGETYAEECQSESCEGEEVSELFESYESECNEESCDVEEVREIAGSTDAINAMLNDFQARGWPVNGCSFVGNCSPAPGNNFATGDTTFGALCTQASINQHWNDFDFDKDDWDGGFGYEAPCDINLPLGRTFNALNLLDLFGTSKPADSNNWLPWFYAYSVGEMDELDGRCGSGSPNGCTLATTNWGPIIDNWTELYWPFFYGQDVPSRAATIVHEARHASWKGHDGGSGCPRGASCDTSWGYWGANTYEVMYLWWLRAVGTSVSTGLRDLAQVRGNAVLGTGFNTRPTNAAVLGAGAANPGAAFSIP